MIRVSAVRQANVNARQRLATVAVGLTHVVVTSHAFVLIAVSTVAASLTIDDS